MDLKSKIRNVPNFPIDGIEYKDITTLIKHPEAFKHTIEKFAEYYKDREIDVVASIESRGFILGAPLAYRLGKGFVLLRKAGKLPSDKLRVEHSLEYGKGVLEIHTDSIEPGQKVLIVDDLLATGGTVMAAIDLVKKLDGDIRGLGFLLELTSFNARKKLEDYDVFSLIQYEK